MSDIAAFPSKLSSSSNRLPLLIFQPSESRLQSFRFERNNSKKKKIPKKLFSKTLVQDQHFQFHIIDEELKIFFEKLKTLKSKLISVIPKQKSYTELFETISEKNKEIFNMKLEETLALSEVIYRIILSKFEQDLEEAGLVPYPFLHRNIPIERECYALAKNCKYLSAAIEAFKGAIAAYRTLAKKKEAKPLEFFELNELFRLLARARLNIGECLDEITFTEKFISEKYEMSENTLKLHSVAEILNVPEEVIDRLKKNTVNKFDDIKSITPKASNEVIEEIFNTRKYMNSLKGSSSMAKSNSYLKALKQFIGVKSNNKILYGNETILKTERVERYDSINDPKLYRNISNIYGTNPTTKFLSSERAPRPSNKVRYFPDLGLKKAVKLGEIVSKNINSY